MGEMHKILWTWRDSNPRPLQCDRGASRGKEEKSCLLRLLCAKITIQLAALLACCASISVPKLFPQYDKARKGDPQTCPNGYLMQMISLKNIVFIFLFRSPDQETHYS